MPTGLALLTRRYGRIPQHPSARAGGRIVVVLIVIIADKDTTVLLCVVTATYPSGRNGFCQPTGRDLRRGVLHTPDPPPPTTSVSVGPAWSGRMQYAPTPGLVSAAAWLSGGL